MYLGDKRSSAQQGIYNPTTKWLQERSEKVHGGSHIHSIDTMNKIMNENLQLRELYLVPKCGDLNGKEIQKRGIYL